MVVQNRTLTFCLFALLLFCVPYYIYAQWTTITPFEKSSLPSVRYSHCAVSIDAILYITHGYFYDTKRSNAGPAWLQDTWSFDMELNQWTEYNAGAGIFYSWCVDVMFMQAVVNYLTSLN